jgi:hypothetical protein
MQEHGTWKSPEDSPAGQLKQLQRTSRDSRYYLHSGVPRPGRRLRRTSRSMARHLPREASRRAASCSRCITRLASTPVHRRPTRPTATCGPPTSTPSARPTASPPCAYSPTSSTANTPATTARATPRPWQTSTSPTSRRWRWSSRTAPAAWTRSRVHGRPTGAAVGAVRCPRPQAGAAPLPVGQKGAEATTILEAGLRRARRMRRPELFVGSRPSITLPHLLDAVDPHMVGCFGRLHLACKFLAVRNTRRALVALVAPALARRLERVSATAVRCCSWVINRHGPSYVALSHTRHVAALSLQHGVVTPSRHCHSITALSLHHGAVTPSRHCHSNMALSLHHGTVTPSRHCHSITAQRC